MVNTLFYTDGSQAYRVAGSVSDSQLIKEFLDKGMGGTELNLSGMFLNEIRFSNQQLTGINFNNATVTNCSFYDCSMEASTFNNATVRNCNFNKADMRRSILSNATFDNCGFDHTQLENSDVDGTAFVASTVKRIWLTNDALCILKFNNGNLRLVLKNRVRTVLSYDGPKTAEIRSFSK